jgi:hypothetical protein
MHTYALLDQLVAARRRDLKAAATGHRRSSSVGSRRASVATRVWTSPAWVWSARPRSGSCGGS